MNSCRGEDGTEWRRGEDGTERRRGEDETEWRKGDEVREWLEGGVGAGVRNGEAVNAVWEGEGGLDGLALGGKDVRGEGGTLSPLLIAVDGRDVPALLRSVVCPT